MVRIWKRVGSSCSYGMPGFEARGHNAYLCIAADTRQARTQVLCP